MPYLVKKTGFWVDILGSVAHYRAELCSSQQVPQSECLIEFPGLCWPYLEPILGPHNPDLAQKTGFCHFWGFVTNYGAEPCSSQ